MHRNTLIRSLTSIVGLAMVAALALTGGLACSDDSDDTGSPSSDNGQPCTEDSECSGDETCVDSSCSCEGEESCDEGYVCVASIGGCALDSAAACIAPEETGSSTPLFREVTAEWGLEDLDVTGQRISALDVDGDGWPDLLIRQVSGATTLASDGQPRFRYLRNTGNGTFEDLTISSGLVRPRAPHEDEVYRGAEVVAAADVDNNGLIDLYLGMGTHDPDRTRGETSELMLQVEPNVFVFAPYANNDVLYDGNIDQPGGASFVDVDRDGIVDLWIPQNAYTTPEGNSEWAQDRLLRGRGDGTFEEITHDVGLTTVEPNLIDDLNAARVHSRAWSSLACDLNDDGLPELLAASYGRAPNHLWQAQEEDGQVSYFNRSVESGYAYDQDFTWQENQFARCFCQANPSAEDCEGVPSPAISCDTPNWQHGTDREPFRLGGNSGTTLCADIANTGNVDLFTTEIRHWWAGSGSDMSELLVNTGEADVRFERPGRDQTGLGLIHPSMSWDEGHMTAALFDVDNDGWLDLLIGASDYPGNRALLFRQFEPYNFRPVPEDDFFSHHRAHGMAIADFDRDGRLDVIIGHSRSRCDSTGLFDCYETTQVRLFQNVGANANWIQLRLEGAEGTNRSAIGAVARITANGVTQRRVIGGGHGHFGMQDDLVIHAGIGDACGAEVEITWPNAERSRETFSLGANGRFYIRQGEAPRPDAIIPPQFH